MKIDIKSIAWDRSNRDEGLDNSNNNDSNSTIIINEEGFYIVPCIHAAQRHLFILRSVFFYTCSFFVLLFLF